jgi:hypothetical protein
MGDEILFSNYCKSTAIGVVGEFIVSENDMIIS